MSVRFDSLPYGTRFIVDSAAAPAGEYVKASSSTGTFTTSGGRLRFVELNPWTMVTVVDGGAA